VALLGIVVVLWQVPDPPRSGVTYTEVGTRPRLFRASLRNGTLLRLDIGIFVLHFVLMASFQIVPGALESVVGLAREHHWQIYLPAVVLSVLGILPMMRLAERGGRHHLVFLVAIAVLMVALALLGLAATPWLFCVALWLFFVGFNYMEAVLPSLVSKAVAPEAKGTALGIFSTAQFLGIFAGGAAGGWVLQHYGVVGITELCLLVIAVWMLVALPAPVHGESGLGEAAP
jgi:predicted MFS family arabinose efflux permease